MLADPQNITLSQGAKSAPRHLTGSARGRFASGDGKVQIEVETSTTGRRARTIVRVVDTKVAADPLTAVNTLEYNSVTITLNRPLGVFSEAEQLAALKGVINWLTASTDTVAKQIIAMEN